jgi:hypothetical protein
VGGSADRYLLYFVCASCIDENTLLQQGYFMVGLLDAHWGRSVTARIGFSVDLDLHEKSLRRIGSRWCKNHVESDLYVFVSVQFFFVLCSV